MNDGTDAVRQTPPRGKRDFKRIYVMCACASGVLGVLGAAAYLFAYANDYEPAVMHYKNGSALIVAAGVFFACSVIAALVCSFLLRKEKAKTVESSGSAALFFTLFTGLMFAAYAVSTVITAHGLPSGNLELAAFFVSIAAAAGLAVRAFVKGRKLLHAALSLFPALFFILLIFIYYFDFTTAPINSPEKGLTNVVLSAAVLFCISDSRDLLGRPGPAFPVFARICASFILTPMAAARIILRFTSGFASPSFIVNVLLLAVGLLAIFRLRLTRKRSDDAPVDGPHGTAEAENEEKPE